MNKTISNNPLFAFISLLSGVKLLVKPGIRQYVVFPLFCNILLYSSGFWLARRFFSEFLDWVTAFVPDWAEWLQWLLWPLFGLSFLLLVFFTFTLAANLIGAPFYGKLAEKAEISLTGKQVIADSQDTWPIEAARALKSELNRQGYFLVRAVPLLILFVIPGLNLIAPFLWFVFSAWFIALEYLSYPLENHGLLFPEQRSVLNNSRWSVTAFGGLVTVALTIPIVNMIIPPVAVAGATVLTLGKRHE